MRFVVALGLACGMATPVAAQDMAVECALQGRIVQAIGDYRLEGVSKRRAERLVGRSLNEAGQKYLPVLPNMVDFVYLMIADTQVDEDLGEVWRTQCLAAAEG